MAVRFDAAADRITHNGSYPQTSAGWTYTAWVRLDVDRDDYSTWLRLSNSGNTVATMGTGWNGVQGSNYYTVVNSAELDSSLTVGVWIPVAGSRSAVTGDLVTYSRPSSATLSQSVDIAPTDETRTPDQVCIGGRGSSDANEWFNGSVAYVRIWSAELSQSEIEAEWASPVPVRTDDLHSNWRLDAPDSLKDTVGSKTLAVQSGGSLATVVGPLLPTENLCPNPAGDVDTTGWVGDLGIATAVNNQTADVVRVTDVANMPKTTGFKYQANGFARSAPAPVTEGQTYSISWFLYQTYGSLPLGTSYLVWYNSSGGDLEYENLGSANLVGDNKTGRVVATSTAPEDAVAVGIIQDGGVDCIISCVLVEEGAAPHDYADGDTDGWYWLGTEGLSASAFGEPTPIEITARARAIGYPGFPGNDPLTTSSFTPDEGELLVAAYSTFDAPPTSTRFSDDMTVSDSQGLTWTPIADLQNDAEWATGTRVWISGPVANESMTVTFQSPESDSWDGVWTVVSLSGASGLIEGLVTDEDAPVDGEYTVTLDATPRAQDAVFFIRHLDNDGSEQMSMPEEWTNYEIFENRYLGFAYRTGMTSSTITVTDTNLNPFGNYKSMDIAFIARAGTYIEPEPDPELSFNLGFFAAI